MERWKINLAVLCLGQFLVMSGMTMVIPFIPLYLTEMGMRDPHAIGIWSGIIFAGNFLTSFVAQPIWGQLTDRFGKKPMLLRSGFGMAVATTLMGFATGAWQLLALRMLNGLVSGFNPAAVALISASAPKERMGLAMGTLQSGAVAGTILGPFIGGLMADYVGFRPIFYITGSLLFLGTILAMILVQEPKRAMSSSQQLQQKASILQGFQQIRKVPQLPTLFSVTFLIQFALLSPLPLIPLYVQKLHPNISSLAFYAGLVSSVTGFSNMLFSPILGRIGDKLGSQRVLLIALIGAAVTSIPQAFVHNIWQLLAARFFFGMCLGGLLPSVNSLINKFTPEGMENRSYSFNSSSLSLGNMAGPIVGGIAAGWIGIEGIFILSAILLLLNALWVKSTLAHKH